MKKAVIAANLAVLVLIWACEEPEPPKISVGPGEDETGQDASSPDADPDGGMQAEPSTPIVPTRNLSKFDPDEVYLLGTLQEGDCYRDAIANVLQPNFAVVGLDCRAERSSAVIRPSDGALLYINYVDEVLHVFQCDKCTDYFLSRDTYPDSPVANDDILRTPPCEPDNNPLSDFRVSFDGDVIHRCASEVWYDAEGNSLATGWDKIQAAGARGNVLRDDGVQNLASGVLTPFTGLPDRYPFAARALDDGFWVAMRGSEPESEPELWHVDFDGIATLVGVYPPPPPGQTAFGHVQVLPGNLARLGVEGDLWQIARAEGILAGDTIIRRTLGGESEVVYNEEDDPLVKIHISSLFTGP